MAGLSFEHKDDKGWPDPQPWYITVKPVLGWQYNAEPFLCSAGALLH